MAEPMNYLDARDACGALNIKAKVLTLDGLHESERFSREFNETFNFFQRILFKKLWFLFGDLEKMH